MINSYKVHNYCNDDITHIENYDQAVNDTTQTWHCHHRFETDLNLSIQELKDRDLYYNRPASELIFLTPTEHQKLHHKGKHLSEEHRNKLSLYNKGKHMSEEAKIKMSKARKGIMHHSEKTKNKMSIGHTGHIWINNGVKTKSIKQDELDYYISLGYTKGRLKRK